jgi:hypothetical protein
MLSQSIPQAIALSTLIRYVTCQNRHDRTRAVFFVERFASAADFDLFFCRSLSHSGKNTGVRSGDLQAHCPKRVEYEQNANKPISPKAKTNAVDCS